MDEKIENLCTSNKGQRGFGRPVVVVSVFSNIRAYRKKSLSKGKKSRKNKKVVEQ